MTLAFLYQPMLKNENPMRIVRVREAEWGENRQEAKMPVPAPVKKSVTARSRLSAPKDRA